MMNQQHGQKGWLASRTNIVLFGFFAIGGFFLLTEHSAHVVPYLPWLLLAACPLMHLFMHRGHGGHDDGGHADVPDRSPGQTASPWPSRDEEDHHA